MGVHRAARIMAAGHGAQVLASQATASVLFDDELDGIALRISASTSSRTSTGPNVSISSTSTG
jgi:hypothetical protein